MIYPGYTNNQLNLTFSIDGIACDYEPPAENNICKGRGTKLFEIEM